jgi:hypothetical protein
MDLIELFFYVSRAISEHTVCVGMKRGRQLPGIRRDNPAALVAG